MAEEQKRKRRVEGLIQKRLRYFYRDPLYGTRFWILDPFIRTDEDPRVVREIHDLLGDEYNPTNLRPA